MQELSALAPGRCELRFLAANASFMEEMKRAQQTTHRCEDPFPAGCCHPGRGQAPSDFLEHSAPTGHCSRLAWTDSKSADGFRDCSTQPTKREMYKTCFLPLMACAHWGDLLGAQTLEYGAQPQHITNTHIHTNRSEANRVTLLLLLLLLSKQAFPVKDVPLRFGLGSCWGWFQTRPLCHTAGIQTRPPACWRLSKRPGTGAALQRIAAKPHSSR